MQVLQTFTKEQLVRLDERQRNIRVTSIAFISERRELIIADNTNKVVRSLRMDAIGADALGNVYRCASPNADLRCVCHVPETSTILVGADKQLLAVQRGANLWRKSHRLKMKWPPEILCALSGARVLCGRAYSKVMCVYRVESGGRIALVDRLRLDEEYHLFAAKSSATDTLVAIGNYSIADRSSSVVLHRLVGTHFERLTERLELRFNMLYSYGLLWLDDKLLRHDSRGSRTIPLAELEVSGTQLVQHRELLVDSDLMEIECWCPIGYYGLALFDNCSEEVRVYSTQTGEHILNTRSANTSPAASSVLHVDSWLLDSSGRCTFAYFANTTDLTYCSAVY